MKTLLACARSGARFAMAVATTTALAATASAGDLDYRAGLGLGYSDNAGREQDASKESETIANVSLRFAYDEDSPRLRADVTGDVSYLDYLGNTFDAEVIGLVNGDAAITLIDERLTWNVSDQWGQVPVDPFTPATPDNRENINYFTTGPELVLGLGSLFRLGLSANYSLVDYEEQPLDSSITGGGMALIRVLSDRSSLSLNAGEREIQYDDETLGADYKQTEGFLQYRALGARTNMLVSAGWSEIDRDALVDNQSGALLRLNVSRRISPSTTVALTGAREFTTTAGNFAAELGTGLGQAPTQQNADPFNLDRVTLTWDYARHVNALSLSAGWSKHTYERQDALDSRAISFGARYHRDLSPILSMNISGTYFKSEFQAAVLNSNTTNLGVDLQWRMSRSLTLTATYGMEERDADIEPDSYNENRFLLRLEYGRGEPRMGRSPPRFGVDAGLPGT
jgi:hypothetical protein